tara:strand:- start:2794 stop:3708 length:915 start_codon:yes stop_codon:yes gene_type:complete
LNKNIFVVGPTCSGKNDFAYQLSKYFKIEIINCDSIQVYKDIEILSNRPNKIEEKIVPHYLYGYIQNKNFSVQKWIQDVSQLLPQIRSRGSVPVFVGGTGLYVQSLIEGISNIPEIKKTFKDQASLMISSKGIDYSINYLNKFYKQSFFPKDTHRLTNRLAFCLQYNDIIENYYGDKKSLTPDSLVVQVFKPKRELYEFAEKRFDKMIKNGAIEEARKISEYKEVSKTLLKAHGLPELIEYTKSRLSLDDAIFKAKTNTKRYIKRQFTWWNNQNFSNLNYRTYFKKSFANEVIKNISIYLKNEQ